MTDKTPKKNAIVVNTQTDLSFYHNIELVKVS